MMTLYFKMWRDHWKSLLSWTLVTITLVSIQMSVYPSIAKSGKDFETFLDNYPDAIKKMSDADFFGKILAFYEKLHW